MDCWSGVSVSTSVSSSYGPRSGSGGISTAHSGTDFTSGFGNYGEGAPVRSFADGVVIASGTTTANGNYVRINHSDGRQSVYLHLLNRWVFNQDSVSAGQQVGTMNCSGNCGPTSNRGQINNTHVHVTVYTTHSGNTSSDAYSDTIDPVTYANSGNCP